MLPLVSRTFALCIQLLPGELRYPVLLAYLLCRIVDTVEDSETLPQADRRRLLDRFGRCLREQQPDRARTDAATELAPLQRTFASGGGHDELLVANAAAVVREFRRLPALQRDSIRPWVQEMCVGMAEFGGSRIRLRTMGDLDRYCYFVAGTVGRLLTSLFSAYLGPAWHRLSAGTGKRRLEQLAVSFGLGLQVTNIVKDMSEDLVRGASFVPLTLCQAHGIEPADLLTRRHRVPARRVARLLIAKASRHLLDALDYCLSLPRAQWRLRIACLLPVYLAVRTLRLARHDPQLLDRDHKVKIDRRAVYRTVAMAALMAPSNALTRRYYGRLAGAAATG